MTDQIRMDALLREVDASYHEARAVAPSKVVPCDGESCDNVAWVGEGEERPWLCWYCKHGRA